MLRPGRSRADSRDANISGTDVFVDYTLVYGEATEGPRKGFRCGFAAICWIVICHVEKLPPMVAIACRRHQQGHADRGE